jgi:hypothetical protein
LSGSWHRVKVVGSELCWVLIALNERKQASKQAKKGRNKASLKERKVGGKFKD